MKLELPAVQRNDRGLLELNFKITDIMKQIEAKDFFNYNDKNTGGFYHVTVSKPRKPRTKGEKSQNHHINGHIQQIAIFTGQPFEDIKKRCKQVAVTRGYPILEDEAGTAITDLWGNVNGISEADASTEDASILIEAIHQLADELEIILREE